MPGCWEIIAQRKVLVGILHVDTTTIAWSFGLRNLQVPGHVTGVSGMPYDMGRNALVRACLEGKYEYLFFLDSDVVPPNDAIYRLLAHKQPIISGLYCRRSPPHGIPVMIRRQRLPNGTFNHNWVTQYNPGSIVEVDMVGAGCFLIHRSVFEKMAQKPESPSRPWFEWKVDMQGIAPPEECLSEDFVFDNRCKRLGYKILVDTGVVCRHVGFGQAGPGSFVPCEATPHT